jgi:hypothetical protein
MVGRMDRRSAGCQFTLKEALEYNRQDALSAAGTGYTEEKIAI